MGAIPIAHGTFSLENEGTGPTDPAHGEWVSFTGTVMLLYASTANSTGSAGVWQMIPVDETTDQHYIKNLWHGPEESRYGDWMAFSGTTMSLAGQDDLDNRVPWKLVPVAAAEDTYHLQNQWKAAAGEPRAGMWAGNNGTSMILTPDDGIWTQRGQYRLFKVAPPRAFGYCVSGAGVAEQINLQIASPDTLVASFVTFEATAPEKPPVVRLSITSSSAAVEDAPRTVVGVTHVHKTAGGRVYYMHFVRLDGLQPHARYRYTVQSGGEGSSESTVFSFRAPYASGPTKIDIFGDMGIYKWNNMEWLKQDCTDGDAADMIVHMGDHAYNEGDGDERRADGYMSAYQAVLSGCPWMPIVGNHEYSGTQLSRYLNQTWEGWEPLPADTALHALLNTGNMHGSGVHGATPSNSSRFFSSDFGLVHLIALDFNLYYGEDPCGTPCREAQLDWLRADLQAAAANRQAVPWVVAMAHFPVFCTGCRGNGVSGPYYASDDAEWHGNCNATAAAVFDERERRQRSHGQQGAATKAPHSASSASDEIVKDLSPLLAEFGVDIFAAGHWHYYESLWPAVRGSPTCPACAQPLAKSFINPKGTVHITTGNGGPPSKDTFTEDCPGEDCGSIAATRKQTTDYGYGRLVAHNDTHIEFTQFQNADQSTFDHFWIVVEGGQHRPFPF